MNNKPIIYFAGSLGKCYPTKLLRSSLSREALFEIERQAGNLDLDLESLRDEVRASGLKSFEDEMNKANNPAPE